MEIVENLDAPLGNSVFSQGQLNNKNLLELFSQQKAYNSSNLFPFQLHLLSYTAGLVAGQSWCEEKIKTVEKQPIAYLYNGVQLPPLPEWDKETYPYAVIVDISVPSDAVGSSGYWVVPQKSVYTVSNNGIMDAVRYDRGYVYEAETDTWRLGGISGSSTAFVKWANYDVCDSSGNVYLSASDPIPVYE